MTKELLFLSTFIIFMFIGSQESIASERVRRVVIERDQIVTVKTAMGVATIIQVPDRPNSVVVGDQEAFKVEYLDQAITIKPLNAKSKSNLYVYTDFRRYNIQLVTGTYDGADYVVYLLGDKPKGVDVKLQQEQGDAILWKKFIASSRNQELVFKIKRLGKSNDLSLFIEFSIFGKKKVQVHPEWIWVIQQNKPRPIQNLLISSLETGSKKPVEGVVQILSNDVDLGQPFQLELRRKENSIIQIPKVDSWK